ncbi:MAG: Xaa-Pro peptidase family protein [Actinobacteria bacterium]|nr:Xaa-Pro peptidase family protein [Actinomycetota bacterium]
MEKYDIDFLLITSKENLNYFVGYDFGELDIDDKYFYCFGILPKDMNLKPTLIVGEGNEGTASASWVEDKRFFGYGKKQFMGLNYIEILTEVINEKGLAKSNFGLELGLGMNLRYDIFKNISENFKQSKFIDAVPLIWDLRKIKSSFEVEMIRRACEITCSGYIEGFKALKEGVSEKYIASVMGMKMLKEGADCFGSGIIMLYSGRDRITWCDGLPSDYKLRKGDLLQVDGGCTVSGYKSDILRMACIGKPSREQEKNYEIAKEASMMSIQSVGEGVNCSQVWKEAEKVWIKHGYEEFVKNRKNANWCSNGHGVGLDIHEPPAISEGEEEILKEGMVITIEAFNTHNGTWPLKDAEWWYLIEDILLVKKNGCEVLSNKMGSELWVA